MIFFWRIAAGLLAAGFLLASAASAADLSYSGVPGKFKRSSKESKEKAAESEDKTQEAPKEKGKRTLVLPRSGNTTAPTPAGGSSKK